MVVVMMTMITMLLLLLLLRLRLRRRRLLLLLLHPSLVGLEGSLTRLIFRLLHLQSASRACLPVRELRGVVQ